VKPGTRYPSILVTTADHDDRVVPAHSFKYAAALQAAQAGDNPVIIRIERSQGTAPAARPSNWSRRLTFTHFSSITSA
jgi:prolyl oligopeptidase PreP (S9A serine peptidase family)